MDCNCMYCNGKEYDYIDNNDPNFLIGKWFMKEHKVLFPEGSKYFPYKWVQSYLIINKQDGTNIWGKSYWRYMDNWKNDMIEWKEELLAGIILGDGTIKFTEVSEKLEWKTTGYLTMIPLKNGDYEVNYVGADRGIIFKTYAKKWRCKKKCIKKY